MPEEQPFDEQVLRGITVRNAAWIIGFIVTGIVQCFTVVKMIMDVSSRLEIHITEAKGDKEVMNLQIQSLKASQEAYKAELDRMKENSK